MSAILLPRGFDHLGLPFKQILPGESLDEQRQERAALFSQIGYKTRPYEITGGDAFLLPGVQGKLLDIELFDVGVRQIHESEGWGLIIEKQTFQIIVDDPVKTQEMLDTVRSVLPTDHYLPNIEFVKGKQTGWHLGIHSPDIQSVRALLEKIASRSELGAAFSEAYTKKIKTRKSPLKRKNCIITPVTCAGMTIELSHGSDRPHARTNCIDRPLTNQSSYSGDWTLVRMTA